MEGFINIQPDLQFIWLGKKYIVVNILDLNVVLAKNIETGKFTRIPIADISIKPIENDTISSPDLAIVEDEDWKTAIDRFNIIKPLLDNPREGSLFRERAKEYKVHLSTIYRWINAFNQTGKLSSLVLKENAGGRGKSRLNSQSEEILSSTIDDYYLNSQRRSSSKTIQEVLHRFRNAGLKSPHPNTIRRRISQISDETKLKYRFNAKASKNKYGPKPGIYKDAEYPLSVIQIDHTKLDIILVDEIHRQPIGRPWITVAIDVFSRMIAGFYLSLDPPGALSTGLCIAHAILPKEKWLTKYGISASWPVWGVMNRIHLDNAKEFHGDMLKRACDEYGIDIEWRPIATPHYGAYIERLLGTFAKEIHSLPGTTFSNPKERNEYNSEKKAVFTLFEFEKWFATYITEIYHQQTHKGIMMSPIRKFQSGIFGTKDTKGTGLPLRATDEERIKYDFMPYVMRSIHPFGVIIDGIHYYGDIFHNYVNKPINSDTSKKKPFLFRRDPRDLSTIYFLNQENNEYFPIPYRDISRPPISLWELRETIRKLKEQNKKEIDEEMIFDAYEKLKSFEQSSIKKSKRIRKAARKEQWDLIHQENIPLKINEIKNTRESMKKPRIIKPFEEMIELDD